jgi:tetratricopeptide (TPR) repeat protein
MGAALAVVLVLAAVLINYASRGTAPQSSATAPAPTMAAAPRPPAAAAPAKPATASSPVVTSQQPAPAPADAAKPAASPAARSPQPASEAAPASGIAAKPAEVAKPAEAPAAQPAAPAPQPTSVPQPAAAPPAPTSISAQPTVAATPQPPQAVPSAGVGATAWLMAGALVLLLIVGSGVGYWVTTHRPAEQQRGGPRALEGPTGTSTRQVGGPPPAPGPMLPPIPAPPTPPAGPSPLGVFVPPAASPPAPAESPPSPPREAVAEPSPMPSGPLEAAASAPFERFVPPRPTAGDETGRDWDAGDAIAGRYLVARKIVSGMGIIYLCHDRVARQPIAIKTYRNLAGGGEGSSESYLARLFETEALIWIRLGRHPNIVEARYVVEVAGKPHLFLELVSGPDGRERTLRDVIREGPRPPAEAIRLLLQMCAGLEHAVSVFPGLVHRDLKPENLLMGSGETVKITDFGLTRVFADVTGRVATLAGTPAYMSPEQCLGLTSLDARADVYALGVILFELVTGKRPFYGDVLQGHLTQPPADPRDTVPDLPLGLVGAIGRCLQKRPEDRFADVAALRAALAGCHQEIAGYVPAAPTISEQVVDPQALASIDLQRAVSLATLGRHEESIVLLEQTIERDPGYADAWRWRGIGLNALGRLDEAGESLDRALALAPRDVESWLEKGRLAVRCGRREDGLASFDTGLGFDPEHIALRYERGTTLFFLGRYAEAAGDLELAHRRQPGRATEAALAACGRRGGTIAPGTLDHDLSGWSSLENLPPVSQPGRERLV